jgi:hypothetical protein
MGTREMIRARVAKIVTDLRIYFPQEIMDRLSYRSKRDLEISRCVPCPMRTISAYPGAIRARQKTS